MPRVGQDVFNSAAVAANRRSIEMLQARRGGQYPAIDPRTTAMAKSAQLREAKSQAIRSGQYFPNNVVEKSVKLRMDRAQRSMDTMRAIREQQ
jgi:hypothetical protein